MNRINEEAKITKSEKIKFMERESNITLISACVAICSFFVLFYAQSMLTNFLKAQKFLAVVACVYAVVAVAVAVFAVAKKKKFLWEYAIFALVMAIGYYFMRNPGVSGLTLIYPANEIGLQSGPGINQVAKLLSATNIKYGLWVANLLYCLLSIALHSVKYNKIKNTRTIKN